MKKIKFLLPLIILSIIVAASVSIWWNLATLPYGSKAAPANYVCDCTCSSGDYILCPTPYSGGKCADFSWDFPYTTEASCMANNKQTCKGYSSNSNTLISGTLKDCHKSAVGSAVITPTPTLTPTPIPTPSPTPALPPYQTNVKCSKDSDCGTNKDIGTTYCQGNDVYQNYLNYKCNNPGTVNSYCSELVTNNLKEKCFPGYCKMGDWYGIGIQQAACLSAEKTTYHNTCDYQKRCVIVEGEGIDTCQTDNDCQ